MKKCPCCSADPIQQLEVMEVHMKVMGIMVPNPRADFYDRTGIVHGS